MIAALGQFTEVDSHKALGLGDVAGPASRGERGGGLRVRRYKFPTCKEKKWTREAHLESWRKNGSGSRRAHHEGRPQTSGEQQAAKRFGRYMRKVPLAWQGLTFCDPRPRALLSCAAACRGVGHRSLDGRQADVFLRLEVASSVARQRSSEPSSRQKFS